MKTKHYSFFRKYASYLVLLFLFFLLAFVLKNLQNKERKTTFNINFLEQYKDSPTFEIAGFEEGENWKGNFTRDSGRTFDGDTGMNIFTQGKPNIITLNKPLNLAPFDTIYTYVNIDTEEMIQKIDSLVIRFQTKDKNKATFVVPRLKPGWNLLTLPKSGFKQNKFDWKQVDETSVELTAKKGETAQIALDRIWSQQSMKGKTDFLSYPKELFNLKTVGKKTFLHLGSPLLSQVLFNKTVEKNDFSYTVSFAPKKFGTFGLSFQTNTKLDEGYFFAIEGNQMNTWRLYKKVGGKEAAIAQDSLKSNIFEKEAYLWLRIEKKGNKIIPSFSVNNQQYVPFKEIEDSSFSKGYVGIFSKGSYLINSVEVKE
ncbi:MAG: hypothetical protein AAB929_03370 [Patescibacteria group bacterium]